MKTRYILLFLSAIVFLTGCQKNLSVSTPTSDSQAQNTSQRLMVKSLKEELREQEQLQAEIAELEQKLFARMAMIQDKADSLLATSEAINIAMDVTLHNIANFKTTGFKKQRIHIQDGRIVETPRIWQQGNFYQTANPLDLVIEGEGFFQILQSDGDMTYTRDGNLHLDRYGNIVTSNGDKLDPQITIPVDQVGISVGSDGSVSVKMDGQSEPQVIGRIELVRFQNPSGLKAVGRNLFMETPASGQPVVAHPGYSGLGRILSGFLEDSNVKIIEELMQLRTLQSWKKGVDQALMTIQEE
jgi:flagellar basal-body rod protein FlgG